MDMLTDSQVTGALKELPGWRRNGKLLEKRYDVSGFKAVMTFAMTIGELAERADHHPDLLLQYGHVTVMLTTHDANGITVKDVALARQIEAASQ